MSQEENTEKISAVKRLRKSFAKISKIVEIPDLIGMQRNSYNRFLQADTVKETRRNIGLEAVFKSVFPIRDFTGSASLEYVSYRFGEIPQSIEECVQRGMTFELPLRITIRLVVYDVDKDSGTSNIRDIKEQEIYFGTIPMMTAKGTFIINGTERAVVSQLHRSSGVFFEHDSGKNHVSGKIIYSCRIIPVRGSWIDMEIDPKDIVHIRIDRRRKFPVTILFKAMGYTTQDLLLYFYKTEKFRIKNKQIFKKFVPSLHQGSKTFLDVVDLASGEIIVKKGRVFTIKAVRKLKALGIEWVPTGFEELLDKAFALPVIHDSDGTLFKANDTIDEKTIDTLRTLESLKFEVLFIDRVTVSDSIRKTLIMDKVENRTEALLEIFRRLRPGNPVTPEVAQEFLNNLFFRSSHYDLSGVGRMKLNLRLDVKTKVNINTLRKEDILLTTKTLVELKDSQGGVDDIDHLGNRRVRSVGELLENQYRIGLVRMERAIKERMTLQEVDAMMPNDLINPKPVTAVVKEFFGTSQLSQFMDQTNPLSETTHKRRLSALGPGGLTRERAGFEVRDVHPSHYGRICPIETPEGPNIGLIVSLSTYARVNDYGFVETPYRVVKDGQVSSEVKFLSAFEEKEHPIAQANAPLDKDNKYINHRVTARVKGEFEMIERENIELMDVSPNQLVSVSASLIPFLENDDANRALMGSNMQRQAVPLLDSESPLVGTGIEKVVAKDSGVTVVAEQDGVVVAVDASRIVVKHSDFETNAVAIYNLAKFTRSNQNTCFNQRVLVKKGQKINRGEIIADGPSTEKGELALGKNVMVAFMPWGGYNFEDSILVSERLVRDGTYSSVHIEEFEVIARDTKLGKEEITRDIPNVGDEGLRYLDDSGIIKLGSKIKSGDILVGKITPKTESQLSPEEKLLRAIFGDKAGDVKDTSLRLPPGIEGIVIDAKVFSRRGIDKDERTRIIEDNEIAVLEKNYEDELSIIKQVVWERLLELLINQQCHTPLRRNKIVLIPKKILITRKMLEEFSIVQLEGITLEEPDLTQKVHDLILRYREQIDLVNRDFERKVSRYEKGDDLSPGVIKMVKIYVAMKRKLSVGDKMAGRHGNKGVVSRIMSIEDMPYFANGDTVDMVLNPLGVPSRMNAGQILEIHLGRAARALGDQINAMIEENNTLKLREKLERIFSKSSARQELDKMDEQTIVAFAGLYKKGVHMETAVFDGAKEAEIRALLKEAEVKESGQVVLYDGRTGEAFKSDITVGAMYMLKLHHLVDDKIHARSIGPYSLVTQQPLGGKAQFGGQRLGEMEVWAMEAYGSAYSLQEFLTVKSDDMAGRTRMYEKIVKGQNVLEPGLPESFKVLTKELQSLGLEITLLTKSKK